MNQAEIAALAGIVLSLAFSYVPGLREWYEKQTGQNKRLVMLGALAVATAGILAYRCRGDGACYSAGGEEAVTAFIAALVANQAADRISP